MTSFSDIFRHEHPTRRVRHCGSLTGFVRAAHFLLGSEELISCRKIHHRESSAHGNNNGRSITLRSFAHFPAIVRDLKQLQAVRFHAHHGLARRESVVAENVRSGSAKFRHARVASVSCFDRKNVRVYSKGLRGISPREAVVPDCDSLPRDARGHCHSASHPGGESCVLRALAGAWPAIPAASRRSRRVKSSAGRELKQP